MTDEDLGQEIICGTGCLPSIGDIRHIGATARRLVTAELAAKALLDEGALVEAIAQRICAVTHHTYSWSEVFARAALSAMRPTLSACVARAEAAEAENARLREAENARLWECPKWVGDPAYEPKTLAGKLGYLVEECAEVLAAVGKTQRWGLESFNPEVPPENRETNREWILREMLDLERAIGMVRAALGDKS